MSDRRKRWTDSHSLEPTIATPKTKRGDEEIKKMVREIEKIL